MQRQKPLRRLGLNGIYRNEQGIVLIMVLTLLPVIAILGATAMMKTITDVQIGANYKTETQAFEVAQAGLEEARARLRLAATEDTYAGDPAANPNPSWSAYILTSNSWQPTDDPEYNAALTNYIPTTASHTNTAVTVNSLQTANAYWVKIHHKREYDAEQSGHTAAVPHYFDADGTIGAHTAVAPGSIVYFGYGDPATPTTPVQYTPAGATNDKPVEVLTVSSRSGRSTKSLEIEVVRHPGPPVTTLLYSRAMVGLNGSAVSLDGTDNCGMAPAVAPVYTMAPATTTVSGSPTFAGSPPAPQSGPLDIDIATYVATFHDGALVLTADQNGTNFGSSTNYKTIYSDTANPPNVGGLKIQNGTGYGWLLVKGDLVLGGGFTWYGVIMVTGTLTLNGGGGGGINVFGALWAGEVININGNIDLRYDSCAITNTVMTQPLRKISWKERY